LKDIALQDPNPNIRKEAIFWISQRGDAEVIPLLEEIAKADDSYEVQKQILFAYAQLDDGGVPQLIRIARSNSDPDIRKEAIFWLSQAGGREVIAFFDELIDSSDNVEVQKSLIFALSQLEDEGVPRLIKIARTHRNPEVRKDAIFWLSQEGGREVMEFFDELIDESDDYEVQKSLVFALSQLGREGVPRLIDIAQTHENPDIRKEALFWISQEGGPQAVRFFEERLDAETDVEVQKSLIFALSQLGEEGVPGLIKAAKSHPSRQVHKDAIFWLGQSDDARAREALLEIVRGQD
ncbi:MAG: HEAT repeat domain-containing protein, partial [Bacteroidetes bacterium]|nr:HEAT repeat domain-containing protein [Bacteroidota bacterium]